MAATQVFSPSATSQSSSRGRWQKQWPNFLFILPHLILFAIFLAWPVFSSLRISLYDWKIMLPDAQQKFIGLTNFQALMKDTVWWKTVSVTLTFTAMTMVMNICFALIVAVALKQTFRGRDFFRTLFFAGSVLSVSVVFIVAARVWDPQRGMLNALLVDGLNLPRIQWLGTAQTVLPSLAVTTVWWTFGFPMLAFLTGLQNIPEPIYEAAKIDGAGPWQTFTQVTLPLLGPTMLFVVSTQFIAHMQMFGQAYTLTAGGPGNESRTIWIYMFDTSWRFFRIGYGATIAVVLAAFMILVTRVWFALFRNRFEY